MKKSIFLFFYLTINLCFSQEIKKYSWEEKPVFEAIPTEFENQPAVVLFDKRWIHTRVGYYAFANFVMNHTAIKINSAEEINKYNKIKAEDNGYIRDLRDFHARLIKPNGEIKIIPQESIVETEIDKIKSIVFEGVEAGDILEYYFILKEFPSSYGVEIYQKDIPVMHAEFIATKEGVNIDFITSKDFSFKNDAGKQISIAKNIPPYFEEKYAKNVKNLVKLFYLISVPSMDNFKWSVFLPTYFKKPSFTYFSKSQAKKLMEKIDLKNGTTDEKIINIDEYLKENFDFVRRGETPKKIDNLAVGKQKLTSDDLFELYGFMLKELKIEYNIAIGMSRFIGDLSDLKYVVPLGHEFMYYIPETGKFISPSEKHLSYGFPMYEIQGTQGLLYKPEQTFVRNRITFPIANAEYTTIGTEIKVLLSEDFSSTTIEKKKTLSGYEGQIMRNAIKTIKENKEEKELIEFVRKSTMQDAKILKYTIDNLSFSNNYTNNPLTLNIDAELNESLASSAGNLLIVNLGKVIGNQFNLYQETERKQDVDINFAKSYKHKIIFQIPVGFEIESYSDLIIDRKLDKEQNCFFKSEVKIVDNQLIVEIIENYESISYPLEKYQEYRNVINAAYDFTKATVVLKSIK